MSSPVNFFSIVVLPALSRPLQEVLNSNLQRAANTYSINSLTSFSFCFIFFKIDISPIFQMQLLVFSVKVDAATRPVGVKGESTTPFDLRTFIKQLQFQTIRETFQLQNLVPGAGGNLLAEMNRAAGSVLPDSFVVAGTEKAQAGFTVYKILFKVCCYICRWEPRNDLVMPSCAVIAFLELLDLYYVHFRSSYLCQ